VRPGGDIVVEATGSASGFERAVSLVRPRGTIVLKSTIASRGAADLNTLVVNEISVIGSRCGPFPRAIRALETGEVDVEWMITARYPLSDGVEALQYAGQRGVLKVLLEPDGRR
jgi:threonine dehydrogenase-like Zn-dependent dehydrogenase